MQYNLKRKKYQMILFKEITYRKNKYILLEYNGSGGGGGGMCVYVNKVNN